MLWFSQAFLKASLAWLGLGVTLGVAMAAHPAWLVYRPAHLHMLVLGFVAMMIFGVAYHVIPRFTGHPLHGPRAAGVQWWLSNTGLALMVLGFVLRAQGHLSGTMVLATGGTLSAVGAYTFIWLIWRTIDGPRGLRNAVAAASQATEGPRALRVQQ
jgi:cbb3-type cytochrome oxidase subunit 1